MCLSDMSQCIFKPSKGIDTMMFAGFNQREQDTAGLGPYIIAMKEPVLSANNEGFDRSLTSIVVDFKSPILQIKSKGIPMVQ